MHSKKYQIAHVHIEVRLPEGMLIPENMSLFEREDLEYADKVIELEVVEDLAPFVRRFQEEYPDAKKFLRKNMNILMSPDKECRIIAITGQSAPYAVYVEESETLTKSWVHREMLEHTDSDTIFGSLLGLEKVMLRKDCMILHSAYICKDGKAILFSAPSETGKSTQAGLWEKYRGARQINGDRSLLVREEDGWYANGWPLCGSSEICYNEAYPIRAIVMLYQAKENVVRRLGVGEAMRKVMSQITINMWNSEFQMKAMDLIQQMVMEVPVYELGCNISEDAVACLEQELM